MGTLLYFGTFFYPNLLTDEIFEIPSLHHNRAYRFVFCCWAIKKFSQLRT